MNNVTLKISALIALLCLLSACTTMPTGPGVLVLPGTGKTFDQFRIDDIDCRQFASSQIGGTTASSASTESGVKSAAVGTVLGAAAGAAINGGRGAGVGAGTGLVFGGLAGTGAANESAYDAQQRYDFGYEQCMYAKGHRIPVAGRLSGQYTQPGYTSTPVPGVNPIPPPPPPK
ncbi:MAG: YMGG-like glycine zipper-containing protein [Burkholderiaceae bacterium]